jgi:hypothetical protein
VYNPRSKVLITEIFVPVRAGQQDRLKAKLSEIQNANRHPLPGTMARYMLPEDSELATLHCVFVWKDTDMPDETTRQQHLRALQEELADVLEWENARSHTHEALMYT